jgi:hypothetical protein
MESMNNTHVLSESNRKRASRESGLLHSKIKSGVLSVKSSIKSTICAVHGFGSGKATEEIDQVTDHHSFGSG